jgi:glycosyltransferase involved in cell wall biosynthesis
MSRPLNFLHLTTFYPPYSFGGDAMYIYRLSHALGDEGHQVDVIHCIDSYHLQHPGEPEISYSEHPNVKRHGIRTKYGALSPLLTHQTGRPYLKMGKIRSVLESKSYDVIHYHNISLLGPEIMTLDQNDRPVIKMYTTHEHWLICPTHVLWKFNSRACEKPECFKCTLLAKRPPQFWRYNGLLKRTSRHVDQFVSPSRFTAKMHAQRGFSEPVTHLPYFIEKVDREWQNPDQRPQEEPYFLFVGRLEKIKGLQNLIDIWSKVDNCDLLVAGTGGQAKELHAQAADNSRIKFLGPLPQRELGNYYYHALATIVPSITYETFGIIIVESFARKTPVIVRDLGALPEVVEDSGGGFNYRSDEELLTAISQLADSPSLRTELGKKGYNAFVQNWSKEAHLILYFNFLEKLADSKWGYIPWKDE